MSNGWKEIQLSEVAWVQSGAGFPEKYQGQVGQQIPFYKVSDMNIPGNEYEMICENNSISEEVRNELGAFLFPKGSIIFPKIGGAIATNKKRRTTRDCCVDNNIMGVVPKVGKIDNDFLFYFFRAHDLSEFANKAHLPSIKKTVVEAWEIMLPTSLAEQRRIVSVLDKTFEGTATVKANVAKNLQNVHTLFESHLQTLFRRRDSGWKEVKLGEITEVQSGGTPSVPKKEYWGGSIPWYSSGELNNTYTTDPERHITNPGLNNSNAKLFPKGSLLVGMYDTAALKMSILDRDGTFNQAIVGVKPNDKIEVEFVLHAINAQKPSLLLKRRGVRQKNLSLGKIKEIAIPLPEPAEQRAIVSKLRTLRTEIERLRSVYERKLTALEALEKTLLHRAFTGQL